MLHTDGIGHLSKSAESDTVAQALKSAKPKDVLIWLVWLIYMRAQRQMVSVCRAIVC